ncbi:hypothetical protein K3M35_23930 [Rhodococcus sp. DMU2021]|uniref:hypothetical protein n=1 Tax=Rhodococcus sp. DMU2021 TaxID=2866997 RepID=UPI001C7CB397|nr:hypothetical protein [Rhodococcus sp. DMU2021]MBX4171657.1 hypothetical protein [Rhodococcus sp. DMU2021]
MTKLFGQSLIRYRPVGRHRRILASSLRTKQDNARRAADNLTALSEDLGLD